MKTILIKYSNGITLQSELNKLNTFGAITFKCEFLINAYIILCIYCVQLDYASF